MRQVVADHQTRKIGAALPARIAIAGDSSRAQNRRAVAQRADLVELVTDVEDRAAFVCQAPERAEQRADRRRRQHRRRLVHDQQLGRLQKAAHDLDALALAYRQRVDMAARIERQAVPCGSLANPRVELSSATALVERQCDVFGDGERLEQRELLEHHADAERACLRRAVDDDRFAIPAYRAGVGPDDAVDDLDQRRFAGAVLAEHCVDLAGHDREIDAVVGDDRRETLGDTGKLEAWNRRRVHASAVPGTHRGGARMLRAPRAAALEPDGQAPPVVHFLPAARATLEASRSAPLACTAPRTRMSGACIPFLP